MELTVFPALNGDCILIEYESSRYILVDGGYADTYQNYLRPMLKQIAEQGGELDMIIVTHIDSDHISGIIKLMEEEELSVPINGILYNGFRHVQSDVQFSGDKECFAHKNICKVGSVLKDKQVSAKQGCTLSALIKRRGIPWNTHVDGRTVISPGCLTLGDAVINILSPDSDGIDNLSKYWRKRLIKDGLLHEERSEEFWDDAFEFSLSIEKPVFHFNEKKVCKTYDLVKICEEPYIPDTSATNGSSISFILEIKGKRLLFLGDAYSETVLNSLFSLYGSENIPYAFDVVKLSHHGCFNNNSPDLLRMISSDKWIISTNGYKYSHPDLQTLSHIITKGNDCGNKLYFNYRLPIAEELMDDSYHENYEFDVIFPEEDKPLIVGI